MDLLYIDYNIDVVDLIHINYYIVVVVMHKKFVDNIVVVEYFHIEVVLFDIVVLENKYYYLFVDDIIVVVDIELLDIALVMDMIEYVVAVEHYDNVHIVMTVFDIVVLKDSMQVHLD